MKYFLICFLFISTAFANCNYFSKNDEVTYIGYNLNYSSAMVKLMSAAGFDRNFYSDYDYEFFVEVREIIANPFHKAYAKITVKKGSELYFEMDRKTVCLTQSCSVSSVANNLNKLFVKARKKLKSCI